MPEYPEFADGLTHLGLALMNEARYQEAEDAMRQSLRLHESARVLTDLGVLYYRQEDIRKRSRSMKEVCQWGQHP